MRITSDVIALDAQVALPQASGSGLKVGIDAPAFSWRDIIGMIELRGSTTAGRALMRPYTEHEDGTVTLNA